jgi:hypothetical protein
MSTSRKNKTTNINSSITRNNLHNVFESLHFYSHIMQVITCYATIYVSSLILSGCTHLIGTYYIIISYLVILEVIS